MSEAPQRDRLEILAALVLACAAVATAWSSYQATRWHGEQARASSRTNAIRIDAARASSLAEAETEVDVATFIQWVDAHAQDDTELADFYVDRFRDEFRPAFGAWIATEPFTNLEAPLTPFAMPEYRVAAEAEADRLDQAAEDSSARVRRDIQRASNYVLAVVLFAVALFFAGMGSRLEARGLRKVMVAIGCAVLVGTVAWIATFPVSVSV